MLIHISSYYDYKQQPAVNRPYFYYGKEILIC